jgi:hypothetical protein
MFQEPVATTVDDIRGRVVIRFREPVDVHPRECRGIGESLGLRALGGEV